MSRWLRTGRKVPYRCLRCRTYRAVLRTGRRQFREKGHIKTMFCAGCGKASPHIQVS